MKLLQMTGFIILLFTLQTSFLPLMAWHGISPDLMLLVTVSFAFLRGAHQGAFLGFVLGLMQDLATGTFLGMNAFSHVLIGYACGAFSDNVFKEQIFLPIVASVVATIANYFILALLMVLLGYRFNLMVNMGVSLLPMLIYQLVFSVPVHYMMYHLDQKLSVKAKR